MSGAQLSISQEVLEPSARVAREEVGAVAQEGDVAAVRRHRGIAAEGVALRPPRGHALELRGRGLAITHEDVGIGVVVGRDQGAAAAERDVPAVRGDRARAVALEVRLAASVHDADALRRPALQIAQEDVVDAVGVSGDEVRSGAREPQEPSVGRDRRVRAVPISQGTSGCDARDHRRPLDEVAHEDVDESVGVARDEIRGGALERDESPVGREDGTVAVPVRRSAAVRDADEGGRAGLAIAEENVAPIVGVRRHEIRGLAREDDVPSVGRDRGIHAPAVG